MPEGLFEKMVGVPGLQPLDQKEAAELDAYLENVSTNVVPVIVRQVTEREKRAVEARMMFIR
jgi:hypothetical protein